MKITSIEIHPANSSDVCVLSFRDPKKQNQYNVKAIVGLDADEIVASAYGVSEGFYNMTLAQRNVVARIELNPRFSMDETYSDLRDNLYRIISSSRTGLVQLLFKNGINVVAAVSGSVKKFETDHDSITSEVQITINCPDPILRGLTRVALDVTSFNPASITVKDTVSTAPHGFQSEIKVLAIVGELIMSDSSLNPTWSFTIDPTGGFLVNDVIHFSSEHNNKYVHVMRAGAVIFIADAILPASVWPTMFPGNNSFVIATPTSFAWKAFSYYNTYWGV